MASGSQQIDGTELKPSTIGPTVCFKKRTRASTIPSGMPAPSATE